MTSNPIESGDFADDARELLQEAVQPVMSALQDIVHHRTADGSWEPYASPGETEALCAEVRAILDQLSRPIRQARLELTRIERAARLRAQNRALWEVQA